MFEDVVVVVEEAKEGDSVRMAELGCLGLEPGGLRPIADDAERGVVGCCDVVEGIKEVSLKCRLSERGSRIPFEHGEYYYIEKLN